MFLEEKPLKRPHGLKKLEDKERLNNRNSCMLKMVFFQRLYSKNIKKNVKKLQEQKH